LPCAVTRTVHDLASIDVASMIHPNAGIGNRGNGR
jgi:hypothetical protein